MPFEFIDNNAPIDRASRKRIRSHVAKGKNVGRKVVRPSRIKAFGRKAETATARSHDSKCLEEAHLLGAADMSTVRLNGKLVIGCPIGSQSSKLPSPRVLS
jgi:hypothetical protein